MCCAPGGTFVYTVRHTADAHYGAGTAHGDDIFGHGGFAVHFFPRRLVDDLAEGWALVEVHGFEERALPRRLWRVTQIRRRDRGAAAEAEGGEPPARQRRTLATGRRRNRCGTFSVLAVRARRPRRGPCSSCRTGLDLTQRHNCRQLVETKYDPDRLPAPDTGHARGLVEAAEVILEDDDRRPGT